MSVVAHAGLAYSSVEEFLAASVPYVRSGLAAGEAIAAATSSTNIAALRHALADDAPRVDFFNADEWYESNARAVANCVRYWNEKQRAGFGKARLISEPPLGSVTDEELSRFIALETLANSAGSDMPFARLCPYDLRIAGLNLDCVESSHPHMAHGADIVSNVNFVDPQTFIERWHATPLAVPDDGIHQKDFNAESLAEMRAFLRIAAAQLGLDAGKVSDLVVAAGEAAANAVEHGGGSGLIRTWRTPREVICDIVSYRGELTDPLRGYFLPPLAEQRGRGIWMMRQLCDWVELRPHKGGSIVRLHVRG